MEFYEKYGTDFSKSRFRIWPQVREFVSGLPSAAIVYDVGCGNGKNMSIRPDITVIGVEPSAKLCTACAERGLDVVQGDARALPWKDSSADAVLMIAVLHHIPPEMQDQALFEIQRVLRPGGRAMITVWAVEQPPGARRTFVPGLNYVEWEGKADAPLPYWIMDAHAASEFKSKLPSQLVCDSLVWNAGNWNFILRKTESKTAAPN